MLDDTSEVIDLVLGCGQFPHVFVEGRSVFVAKETNHLTGLCVPSVRGIMGFSRIDYDLLLVVVGDLSAPLQSLKDNVAARKFVGLPKTVPTSHSLDMLAHDGRMSDWLVSEMISDMRRYTLDRRSALDLIESGHDRFIQNVKAVFKDMFHQEIEMPLAKLA